MKKRTLCVIPLLLLGITIGSLIYAQEPTVFGPKDLTISWLRIHLSFHRFTVDDPGDGLIIATKNTPEKKIGGGFLLLNGTFISLEDFFAGSNTVFEQEISLQSASWVLVFLTGQPGASVRIEGRKENPIEQPEVTFAANPPTVPLGEIATLSWTTVNADTVTIDHEIGEVSFSGSLDVSPPKTTTYTITAAGPGGTATASAQVMVVTPPKDVDYGLQDDEQQGGGGLLGMKIRILNGKSPAPSTRPLLPLPQSTGTCL